MSEEDGGGTSSEAHDELARRDERLLDICRAHRRLQHLYDISRLLACFESVERTIPEVMAIFDEALTLDSAVFILDAPERPRTLAWRSEADGEHRLRAAKVHAQLTYRSLMRCGIDLESAATMTFAFRRGEDVSRTGEQRDGRKNFVLLPLALERGDVLGALQIEGAYRLDEQDLAFMSAVVDELAIAVDRCATKTARSSTRTADASSFDGCLVVADNVHLAAPALADIGVTGGEERDGAMPRLRLELDAVRESRIHARTRRACGTGDTQRELERGRNAERRRRSRSRGDGIQRSAARMDHLFSELVDAAAIEASRLSIAPELAPVTQLVAAAVDSCRSLAARKDLSVVSEVQVDLRPLYADPRRLEQVLASLLGNAANLAPLRGTVTVRAESIGDETVFSVGDDGPGIPEGEIPHLFDPLREAGSAAHHGTGLGLFIVKGIVEAHGGRIWVESAVDSGSKFFFALPPAAPTCAAQGPRAARWQGLASCDPQVVTSSIERRAALLVELAQGLDLRNEAPQTVLESARVARELTRRAVDFRRDLLAVLSDALRMPLAVPAAPTRANERRDRRLPTRGQQQTIRQMFAAMRRLTSLIEQLVEHAVLRGGRPPGDIEWCSVDAIVGDVLDELRPYAIAKGLGLGLRQVGVVAPLRRDPALVRLVLLNLVENAIRSTDRGLVEVVVDCDPCAHRLAVIDSGPGIGAGERAEIFEPFATTAERPLSRMVLGLTLVREVASALGGQVDVESEEGCGSAFTVTLPRMAHELREARVAVH